MIVSAISNGLSLGIVGSGAYILYGVLRSALGMSSQREIIVAMSDSYSNSLRVAMGIDPPEESQEEYIARLEHEMMIEGHQYECPICIENNMTVRQKAIRAIQQKWSGNYPR